MDLQNWIRTQLEEELDATDQDILTDNIRLISEFCSETYNLDNQLLNIMTNMSYQVS